MTQYKVCSECGKSKELSTDNFQPSFDKRKNKTYFKGKCRECLNKYQREFFKQNPEYGKNWKAENKDWIRQQERERRAIDINFKLKKNVSRSISHALNKVLSNKNGLSTIKYLPYTLTELKEHLEKQFDSNMSWGNYGSYWHIDHIVPHSLFAYTSMEDDNFQKCWALSNLRPLEAHQNMSDGSTRVRHKKA